MVASQREFKTKILGTYEVLDYCKYFFGKYEYCRKNFAFGLKKIYEIILVMNAQVNEDCEIYICRGFNLMFSVAKIFIL